MIIRLFRIGMLSALSAMIGGMALASGGVTFRVIYNNQNYDQPGGLIEGSPGVFYAIAGSGPIVAFSVTTQGSRTLLAGFPAGASFQSLLYSGPNGRFYSSVYSAQSTNNIFSVTSEANSQRTYPSLDFDPTLLQSLPDGTFLGEGTGGPEVSGT